MKTPTLVIHGLLDYRVPDSQGLAYYNTLKAKGVPTRLVFFPDENHWILKPQNSRLWYREFFAWLKRHVATGGKTRSASALAFRGASRRAPRITQTSTVIAVRMSTNHEGSSPWRASHRSALHTSTKSAIEAPIWSLRRGQPEHAPRGERRHAC